VHFGDTPNDIKAAAAAGALPVALATGAFTVAQLRQAAQAAGVGATTIVLDDLRDTAAVLKAMGV
jgi:phosphoglycolate phosphatase-like HAD superfamily hydrolase